jgi:hypothetical protein
VLTGDPAVAHRDGDAFEFDVAEQRFEISKLT